MTAPTDAYKPNEGNVMTHPMQPLASHLAHVELLTPNPEASLWFFRDVLGLEHVESDGQSAYLRAWGDVYHHSIKLTEAPGAGLGHMAWRTIDEETLDRVAANLEQAGRGEGWIDGDRGHGRAYRYTMPDGHPGEVLWEVDWYEAPSELRSPMPSRPQRYTGHGAAVRRIDHVTLLCTEVEPQREFLEQQLGFRHREGIFSDDMETEIGAWLAVTNMSHDTAYLLDGKGASGRLHHVAFWHDTREEVLRAADLLKDFGFQIELGPTRHSLSEAFFLYVFEPGGNRVEIYNSGGGFRFAPDWGPVKWTVSQRPTLYWPNNETPPPSLSTGSPALEGELVQNSDLGPRSLAALD
jgi:catechol 2,3-dioxygenase